jgi:hypothetical protein
MAHKVIDRCKETTSTTGTGNLTLTGAAAGFVSVANSTTGLTSDGDTSWFCAEAGSQWEVFLGTRVSATELARTTLLSSSSGSTVNFTAPPVVFSTVPAKKISAVGPAFRAYLSSAQTGITSTTWTKIALNTEEFDTDACYDNTTNYRFTPNVEGYYQFSYLLFSASTTLLNLSVQLRKNGATAGESAFIPVSSAAQRTTGSRLLYMNGTTDYVELWGYLNGTGLQFSPGVAETSLSGHFVRGV